MRKTGKPSQNGKHQDQLQTATNMAEAEQNSEASSRSQKDFVIEALDEYEQRLTAYACRLYGGDLNSARDAVQHTFLKLCQQPVEKVASKLAPWLYSVCRNRILDDLKSKRRKMESVSFDFESVDRRASDPAKQLETEDMFLQVKKLLPCLTDNEREVIDLWSFGLSANEIAEILNKKAGTVRVNLHRAVQRLRKHPDIQLWLERATGQVERQLNRTSTPTTR